MEVFMSVKLHILVGPIWKRSLHPMPWLCLEFPCLVMSHNWILTVSLSGRAKCLLCAETLAFLAESRPLGR